MPRVAIYPCPSSSVSIPTLGVLPVRVGFVVTIRHTPVNLATQKIFLVIVRTTVYKLLLSPALTATALYANKWQATLKSHAREMDR